METSRYLCTHGQYHLASVYNCILISVYTCSLYEFMLSVTSLFARAVVARSLGLCLQAIGILISLLWVLYSC